MQQSKVLKALRHEHGLTQAVVADRFGLSLEGYRAYEKGYSRLRADKLSTLAEALEVSAAELASRLGLGLPSNTGALRSELAAVLGPDKAEMLEEVVEEIRDWPEDQQQFIVELFRNQTFNWPRRPTRE